MLWALPTSLEEVARAAKESNNNGRRFFGWWLVESEGLFLLIRSITTNNIGSFDAKNEPMRMSALCSTKFNSYLKLLGNDLGLDK